MLVEVGCGRQHLPAPVALGVGGSGQALRSEVRKFVAETGTNIIILM